MTGLQTRLAAPHELAALLALRHEVFVVGQGVPADLEHDASDPMYDHAVARLDGRIVGTGRLLPDGTVGRMAVAEEVRGQGVGAAVLAVLERRAAQRGLAAIELHAQVHAVGFYERAGYVPFTDVYLEAGIEHVSMRKPLISGAPVTDNLAVVNAFLAVAAKRDWEAAFALVTDDIEYQNMMLAAVTGKQAMKETGEGLLALCEDSEWLVLHEVANGDLVMNERTDRFCMNGVWTDLPVAGVFHLRDGLISSWHDYFDLQTVMTAMFPDTSA